MTLLKDNNTSSATIRNTSKRKVFEEKDIPSHGYDVPQLPENCSDTNSMTRYLSISQWCLCVCDNLSSRDYLDKDSFPKQALPEDGKFSNTHVIFGSLDPFRVPYSSPTNSAIPIPIAIKRPKTWVIDRSHHLRGIWVQSSTDDIWYWLKDPSTDVVDSSSPSQETLHIPLRAKLGLLSNILDMVQETNQGTPFNYVAIIGRRHPEAVHRMLTPTSNQWEYFRHLHIQSDEDISSVEYPFLCDFMGHNFMGDSYPLLNQEPFDLDLLKTCADFVRRQLTNIHPFLSKSSNFMKGLTAMHTNYIHDFRSSSEIDSLASPNFKQFSLDDYVDSAIQSEKRSFRQPWGEPMNNLLTQPNRWIEFIVQYNLLDVTELPIPNGETSPIQEVILCDSVECILRGVKEKVENPIPKNVLKLNIRLMQRSVTAAVTSDYHRFSSIHLCLALRGLSSALLPTPTPHELIHQNIRHDDISKYQFAEKSTSSIMDMILGDYPDSRGEGHVSSMEWMYIIIDCLRRSQPKVIKALFKSKTKETLSPFVMIFKHWLPLAVHRIKTMGCIEKARILTECRFIQSTMKFIVDCTVINTMNQITILHKLSVDWFYIVDKILNFSISNNLIEIIQSAKAARKHLDAIKANSFPLKGENADSTLAVPRPVQVAPASLVPTTITHETETKDKEMTQKRLSQLLRIAKGNAGDIIQKPQMNQPVIDAADQPVDLSQELKVDLDAPAPMTILGHNNPKSSSRSDIESNHKRKPENNPGFSKGSDGHDNGSIYYTVDDNTQVTTIEKVSLRKIVAKEDNHDRGTGTSGNVLRNADAAITAMELKKQGAESVASNWASAKATDWTVSSWADATKLSGSVAPSWGSKILSSAKGIHMAARVESANWSVRKIIKETVAVDASTESVSLVSNMSLGSSTTDMDTAHADPCRDNYDGKFTSEYSRENNAAKSYGNVISGSTILGKKGLKSNVEASGWANANSAYLTVSSSSNATKIPGSTATSMGSWKSSIVIETNQVMNVHLTTDRESSERCKSYESGAVAAYLQNMRDKSCHTAPLAQDHGGGIYIDKPLRIPESKRKYIDEDGEINEDKPVTSPMKRKISDLRNASSKFNFHASTVDSLSTLPSALERSPSSSMAQGRGRGRVLPAWMTTTAPIQEHTKSSSSQSLERSIQPSTVSDSSSFLPTIPSQLLQTVNPRMVSDASRSTSVPSGRGQGRDRNLPAWMTTDKMNN